MIEYGVTRIRSHAQIDTDCRLERLEGVAAAREAHRGRADIEIVAFPQSGILRDPGTLDLLDAALTDGADLVGGIDPAGVDRDPVSHLDAVFGLAQRHQRGIDIHLHDRGELGAFQIELICERVTATGMQGRVTISHCFALATVSEPRQRQLIELLDCGKSLTCPYHNWTYTIDGSLIGIPDRKRMYPDGIRMEDYGLVPIRVAIGWGKVVFGCLSRKAPPFEEWVAPIMDRWNRYDIHEMSRFDRTLAVDYPINWKLFAENTNDDLHVRFVHNRLNEIRHQLDTQIFQEQWTSRGYKPHNAKDDPSGSRDAVEDASSRRLVPRACRRASRRAGR